MTPEAHPSAGEAGAPRILVRGANWVGDAVMTLPTLSAIRENFPRGHLTVLARPWVLPVYGAHPAVDRVMACDRGTGPLPAMGMRLRTIREIRRARFDLAVIFPNSFEAALTVFLAGVPCRLGFDTDGRRILLTHPARRSRVAAGRHQAFTYLSLLASRGWPAPYRAPALRVSPADGDLAGRTLAELGIAAGDTLVGLGPGAAYGPSKRWPPERFARVGDWAARRWGARVVLLGSWGDRPACSAVAGAMTQPVVDLCGALPLGAAMGVLRRCRLTVTNDSGLMHLSAGLGTPTVAVFGSTDPVATGPLGPFARVVRHTPPCAPCFLRACPSDFACMLRVTPERVWEGMTELRRESAPGPRTAPPADRVSPSCPDSNAS